MEPDDLEHNKLGTILASIQDGVIAVGHDKRVLLVNQAARSAFKLPDEDLAGRLFDEVFPQPELRACLDDKCGKPGRRDEITVGDERIFSIRTSRTPELGWVISLHNITELKKLSRIQTDFVSRVSHDLRSPLTTIQGYADLVERVGTVNEMQRDFLHRIQASVRNTNQLLENLLKLGRIEANVGATFESTRMEQLLGFALEGAKKSLADKNLQLRLDISENLPPILGSAAHLQQMIDILLDNSIKYTPMGGQVAVSLQEEQEQIALQVSDTGIGIPSAELQYVFEKFYRAANARTLVPGTGMGLAMVKLIVENHGGRVWVSSDPGKGTTITIVLPVTTTQSGSAG